MRHLNSRDILSELKRIDERFDKVEQSNSKSLLGYLQDFYNHLNGALGAFEELELSISLNESLTENDLQSFIKALSVDVGKISDALDKGLHQHQNHKQQFKTAILKIRDTYKYFMMEYDAVKNDVDKKIRQYIWLMKQAVFSLDADIKKYNEMHHEDLQTIFEDKEE